MDEAKFRAELEANGYTVLERTWEPGTVNDSHAHDFSARLLCLEGSMEVTTSGTTQSCQPGDKIEVMAGVVHREVVGPEGVRLLVGRR